MVNFWCKLVNGHENKLSSYMYRILLDDVSNSRFEYDWFSFVKSIFDSIGLSYIWLGQNIENSFWLSQTVQITTESQFKQEWQTSIDTFSKCINYRLFKTEHKFENYLLKLPPKLMKTFIKFRLCNNVTCRNRALEGNTQKP